jgi:hypothetical protein
MKIPREICPSTNRIAPAGIVLWWLTWSSDSTTLEDRAQKNPAFRQKHWEQFSMISSP